MRDTTTVYIEGQDFYERKKYFGDDTTAVRTYIKRGSIESKENACNQPARFNKIHGY